MVFNILSQDLKLSIGLNKNNSKDFSLIVSISCKINNSFVFKLLFNKFEFILIEYNSPVKFHTFSKSS